MRRFLLSSYGLWNRETNIGTRSQTELIGSIVPWLWALRRCRQFKALIGARWTDEAQPRNRPERPTAALLGSRRAAPAGARSLPTFGVMKARGTVTILASILAIAGAVWLYNYWEAQSWLLEIRTPAPIYETDDYPY